MDVCTFSLLIFIAKDRVDYCFSCNFYSWSSFRYKLACIRICYYCGDVVDDRVKQVALFGTMLIVNFQVIYLVLTSPCLFTFVDVFLLFIFLYICLSLVYCLTQPVHQLPSPNKILERWEEGFDLNWFLNSDNFGIWVIRG